MSNCVFNWKCNILYLSTKIYIFLPLTLTLPEKSPTNLKLFSGKTVKLPKILIDLKG
jgi:hypothetical protein